ncbi:hypothetical protein HOF92_06475 [bacterium]|jgi:hypothetical protein|nr:hypothetical protein [bacterium]
MNPESSINNLKKLLNKAGFDLFQTFSVQDYNRRVNAENRFHSDSPGAGILVGNTRSIWPHFLGHLQLHDEWINRKNPFDDFVEFTLLECLRDLPIKHRIRYAHRPEPFHISFQKLAQYSGLAFLSKSHLSVHPHYGSWFSLRAALVLEIGLQTTENELQENPCSSCEHGCIPAFQVAMRKDSTWREWLKVRDSCPLGKNHRFSEQQIEYHYTKNQSVLRELLSDQGSNIKS